jgi:hypothetical protein
MPTGNIDSRASLELIYPPDAFAQDAARNGQVTNQVALGIRILSAPNAAGNFETERAGQQVGEAVPPTFLAPHRREERLINAGCESPVAIGATRSARRLPSLPRRYPRRSAAVRFRAREKALAATSRVYRAFASSRNLSCVPRREANPRSDFARRALDQICWIAERSQFPPRDLTKVHSSSASTGSRGSPPTSQSGSPGDRPARTT